MEELSETSIEFILELNSNCSYTQKHCPEDWIINQIQSLSNFNGKVYRGLRFSKDQYDIFIKKNKIKNGQEFFILNSSNYSSWSKEVSVAEEYSLHGDVGLVLSYEISHCDKNMLIDIDSLPEEVMERLEYKNEGGEVILLPCEIEVKIHSVKGPF